MKEIITVRPCRVGSSWAAGNKRLTLEDKVADSLVQRGSARFVKSEAAVPQYEKAEVVHEEPAALDAFGDEAPKRRRRKANDD